jgi:hypothetical protein
MLGPGGSVGHKYVCNFQFMKNYRNGNNSMMTHKARTYLASLEF